MKRRGNLSSAKSTSGNERSKKKNNNKKRNEEADCSPSIVSTALFILISDSTLLDVSLRCRWSSATLLLLPYTYSLLFLPNRRASFFLSCTRAGIFSPCQASWDSGKLLCYRLLGIGFIIERQLRARVNETATKVRVKGLFFFYSPWRSEEISFFSFFLVWGGLNWMPSKGCEKEVSPLDRERGRARGKKWVRVVKWISLWKIFPFFSWALKCFLRLRVKCQSLSFDVYSCWLFSVNNFFFGSVKLLQKCLDTGRRFIFYK